MFNAFAMGEIADLDLQAQIEKRVGDSVDVPTKQEDEKMFGAYLKVAKQIDNLNIGFAALTTKDGYVSGENLPVTYLTNDDLGTASLDRVGTYGDTSIFALNFAYDLTKEYNIIDAQAETVHRTLSMMGKNDLLDDN